MRTKHVFKQKCMQQLHTSHCRLPDSLERRETSRSDWARWLTSLGDGSKEAQILQHRAFVHQDQLYATICQVTKGCQAHCALITSAGGHNGHHALELSFYMLPAPLQHHSIHTWKLCPVQTLAPGLEMRLRIGIHKTHLFDNQTETRHAYGQSSKASM